MKKNNITYLLLLLFIFGCSEDSIETFNLEDSKIFFQAQSFSGAGGSERYSTSTFYSFVGTDLSFTEYVFNGNVRLMGDVKNFDRKINVVVDHENTTMIEGIGFEFNSDTLKIRAGENSTQVGVRFFRTKDLLYGNDTLTLMLKENEHFSLLKNYKSSNDWTNTAADTIDGTRYTFVMTEVYNRPGSWHGGSPLYVNTYFGEWNPTKFIYVNDFFGFTLDDWNNVNSATSKLSIGRMQYYAKKLQEELQKRADNGNPVLDEDESYMQLPEPYNVDYSRN